MSNFKLMENFYDSHLHLDLLFEKLGYLKLNSSQRKNSKLNLKSGFTDSENQILGDKIKEVLQKHFSVIQATVSTQNLDDCLKILGVNPKISFLAGSHPEIVHQKFNINSYLKDQTEYLKSIETNKSAICGIGEVGLDYYHTQDQKLKALQAELFESQIQLAVERELPLIIHCREAFDDVLTILKNFPKIHGKFLIHCFTGDFDHLKRILDLGGLVAFGGIVTFKNAQEINQALKMAPLDTFILETDLPFLAPFPHRGEINLPAYIELIAKYVSTVKSVDEVEIWQQTGKTYKNFFKIG